MLRNICAVALALFAPFSALAQKKPLSLEEAVAAGIAASPGLHAAQMSLESSAAKAKEMRASRLPSFKLGAGYARLSEVPPFAVTTPGSPEPFIVSENYFNNWSLRLSLHQPLYTGNRLEAGAESARLLEQSAGQDLEKDRADFVFAVKSAYWGLARARELLTIAEENLRQVGEHLRDVRAFFDQGLLTRNEVLRAELEVSNAELLRLDARNGAEIALTSLNSLIGLPLATDVELTTSAENQASRPADGETAAWEAAEPQALIDAAMAVRPELKSADFRIKASEAGVKAAKSGLYPQVFLSGNYYYLRPNPRYMPARDEFIGTWDVGISVAFDVWDWGRTKSQAGQAKAQLAQARDARKLLEDLAVLEVTQSRLTLVQAREKARVAAQAVGQAEENLRVTRERFKQGVALNADVLDADVALLRARTVRAQAGIEIVLAQARLEKALGR
jgi:outer membrane protein TolC